MRTPFKKKFHAPRLTGEEQARQGRVVRTAQATLVTTEAVREFLNNEHKLLGGRPIDLAIASASGLLRVEQYIAGQAEIRASSVAAGGGASLPTLAGQRRVSE